jgi:hypothetical protein
VKQSIILLYTTLLFVGLNSCSNLQPVEKFTTSNFRLSDNVKQQLCFKVYADDFINAGIQIKKSDTSSNHNIVIPLKTKNLENNETLLSTSSQYDNFLLINYRSQSISQEVEIITFNPILNQPLSDNSTIDELSEGIYLLKNGLERKFIYNFSKKTKILEQHPSLQVDSLNNIAISLPERSKGIEVKNGQTSLPQPVKEENNVKYFRLNGTSDRDITIGYILPANSNQIFLFELLVKIFGVFLIPLFEFLLIKPSKKLKPKIKKIVTISAIILEILILALLAYLSFTSASITKEKIGDLAILIAGALVSFFLMIHKKDDKDDDSKLPPP